MVTKQGLDGGVRLGWGPLRPVQDMIGIGGLREGACAFPVPRMNTR